MVVMFAGLVVFVVLVVLVLLAVLVVLVVFVVLVGSVVFVGHCGVHFVWCVCVPCCCCVCYWASLLVFVMHCRVCLLVVLNVLVVFVCCFVSWFV